MLGLGSLPLTRLFATAVVCSLCLSTGAQAQLCFTTPKPVPGLPGAPDWYSGAATDRNDLSDPRWAAAFWRMFEEGGVGSLDAGYRILYDPSAHALVVSVHALADAGAQLGDLDEVFFGITTGDTTAAARGVRIIPTPLGALPSAGADPKPGTRFRRLHYAGTAWTYLSNPVDDDNIVPSPTPEAWLMNTSVWSSASSPADWAINFRVDLAALGIPDAVTPFRIAIGLHVHNEPANTGLDGYTPGAGFTSYPGLFAASSVASWSQVAGAGAACADAITLAATGFGIENPSDPGGAPYSTINRTLGDTNAFKALPSMPAGLVVFPGLLEANFRIANWGSVADPAAAWPVISGGDWVDNGANGAAATAFRFDCPANNATGVCGMPIVTTGTPGFHQCIQVELREKPGAGGSNLPIVFNPSTQYRNTYFADLSTLEELAEINVKGLATRFGDTKDRTVYLHLDTKNLPPHQEKPMWLPSRAMQLARRKAETPSVNVIVRDKPPTRAELAEWKRALAARRPGALAAAGGAAAAAAATQPDPKSDAAEPALTIEQLLDQVYPTYTVRTYYSVGQQSLASGASYERLRAMYPFQYRFEHEGPLYGFSHSLVGEGVTLQPVSPELYKLVVPNESAVAVRVKVTAEEAPLRGPTGPGPQTCPPCEKTPHGGCGRCAVGSDVGSPFAKLAGLLFSSVMLGVFLYRLRRRGRRV